MASNAETPLGAASRCAARALRLAGPLLAVFVACSDTTPVSLPATDQFYYPTGIAVRHEPPGCVPGTAGASCTSELLVVSSNFDLRFDSASGGTVSAVDVDAAVAAPSLAPLVAPALLGVQRIGSFGGQVAVVDEASCPGWTSVLGRAPQALVASRSQELLYRLDLDAAGAPSCGAGCQVPLGGGSFGDPYGVTVACRALAGGGVEALAYVTYLRAVNSEGWISRIDLTSSSSTRTDLDLGTVPTHTAAFDPVSDRLYVTERAVANGSSPLRWLDGTTGLVVTRSFTGIRGSDLRGIALSTPAAAGAVPSRAYVAMRLFDADLAATTTVRPSSDIGGALAILDLSPGLDGQPSADVLDMVPIDRGATEIVVVPRDVDPATGLPRVDPALGRPRRDLVAVTCTDDNTVVLYDDELGVVANVFGLCGGAAQAPAPCLPGFPITGAQPFGLAVERLANGHARLYVGSFDRSFVNVIEIDPSLPGAPPVSWTRLGPERT